MKCYPTYFIIGYNLKEHFRSSHRILCTGIHFRYNNLAHKGAQRWCLFKSRGQWEKCWYMGQMDFQKLHFGHLPISFEGTRLWDPLLADSVWSLIHKLSNQHWLQICSDFTYQRISRKIDQKFTKTFEPNRRIEC